MDNYEIRQIKPEEAEQAARMEQTCFPANEACPYETMVKHAAANPWCFIVAIDKKTGLLAGLINGIPSDAEAFSDDLFTNKKTLSNEGKNVFICGLEVLPEHRGCGLARELVQAMAEREKAAGRESLILTCHDHLVPFYNQFGFELLGPSKSTWGGVEWMEMKLRLN